MAEGRGSLIEFLNQSPLRELSGDLLRSVPGLPPVFQTVHLLGAAVLMGTAVMLSLRLLSLVAHNQDPGEMSRRLFPWFFQRCQSCFSARCHFFWRAHNVICPTLYLTSRWSV